MNFYCHFCNQRCKKITHWNCLSCKASFLTSEASDYLYEIWLSHQTEDFRYTVKLLIDQNKTEVYALKKHHPTPSIIDSLMDGKLIMSVKPVWNQLTPQNISQKLQTILTFL